MIKSFGRASEALRSIVPGPRAWSGVVWGIVVASGFVLVVRALHLSHGGASIAAVLLCLPLEVGVAAVAGAVAFVVVRVLGAPPARYRWLLLACLYLLAWQMFAGPLFERLIPTLFVLACSSVAGAAVRVFVHWRSPTTSRPAKALAIGGFATAIIVAALGVRWFLSEGQPNIPALRDGRKFELSASARALTDPSEPGERRVSSLYYGSGTDRRRPQYGAQATLHTKPVDGARFIDGWSGLDGWARTHYWGFDAHAMPLNGHLWYPDGDGPFPVVIAVHGGHPMQDSSEPGYDYLGEHLASRGYVFATVDENFLNGAPWYDLATGVTGENPARGYLVLEHLKAFRGWNEEPGNPFFHKLDLSRVALIGHSKGGEAIAIAAAWNNLPFYPEDANLRFDYGFGIRSLVALSTTDKQYQPKGSGIPLRDINYLALQGSNDGDVDYFMGVQQLDRVSFSGTSYRLKTAVYVHGANHAQWNRVWARRDKTSFPKQFYFNRRPLLPAASQERIAKAYIAAFFDVTLMENAAYVPFLKDHRIGAAWLPSTIYVNRFADSADRYITRFDEDLDLSTTALPGGHIIGQHLTVWREHPVGPKMFWPAQESSAAFLGWDTANNETASYTIELPAGALSVEATDALVFGLADANEPASRRPHAPPRPTKSGLREPIDLTIELRDRSGHGASLPLSSVAFLQPELEARVWKAWFIEKRRPEAVFQTFEMPLAKFVEKNPHFDPRELFAIRFVFDRTPTGVVVLDDVGLTAAHPK